VTETGYRPGSAPVSPAASSSGPDDDAVLAGKIVTDPVVPVADVSAQPTADTDAGYVPAPVSFVSDEEDDDYGTKSGHGYSRDDRDRGDSAPGWRDSGRAAKDKVFDVSAGRRRPVVFEEEDDLDIPDFLK
jgi:hypothetical protein